jgi:hypothetical protein
MGRHRFASAEVGQLAEVIGQQIVDRDPVLGGVVLHLVADRLDGCVEFVIRTASDRASSLGSVALPVELRLVAESDERCVAALKRDAAMAAMPSSAASSALGAYFFDI